MFGTLKKKLNKITPPSPVNFLPANRRGGSKAGSKVLNDAKEEMQSKIEVELNKMGLTELIPNFGNARNNQESSAPSTIDSDSISRLWQRAEFHGIFPETSAHGGEAAPSGPAGVPREALGVVARGLNQVRPLKSPL